jgi:hypothetical protein
MTPSPLLPLKNAWDGFWRDLTKGTTVVVEATNQCNLKCPKCSRDPGIVPASIQHPALIAIIRRHRPVDTIIFAGLGEPFLNNDFGRIASIAKIYCKNVIAVTNGIIDLVDHPALKYLDHIVVSMDNLEDGRRTKNVRWLKRNWKGVVAVNFVRTPQNYWHEGTMKLWCEDVGVLFHVTPIQNFYSPEERGYAAAHGMVQTERIISGKRDKSFRLHCPYLTGEKVYYDAMGRRHPCCIRLRYDQVVPTPRMCETCPE